MVAHARISKGMMTKEKPIKQVPDQVDQEQQNVERAIEGRAGGERSSATKRQCRRTSNNGEEGEIVVGKGGRGEKEAGILSSG